jgi:hypothetical protein
VGVDWHLLCKAAGLTVDGDHVSIALDDGRRHRVAVSEQSDAYRLTAIVAGRAVLSQVADAPIRIWLRNRETRIVVDRRAARAGLLLPVSVRVGLSCCSGARRPN